MKWLMFLIAMWGNYLNVRMDWKGFLLWIVADGFFCIACYLDGEYAEAAVFGLYVCVAAYGIIEWRKK